MPLELRRLTSDDSDEVSTLWHAAHTARRRRIGLAVRAREKALLTRSGVFGVGLFDPDMVAVAVAMPAREDDGRSSHNVPGLAHISSVATVPERWGQGLGAQVVSAILLQAIRSGFARAQLWTQSTNLAAQRLYERAGFVGSGRQRPDGRGEHILHYICDLPALATRSRPAARVLCRDDDERLLLLHFRDPADGSVFWEPPGGGLEPGETALEAVQREWHEETDLPLPQVAPEPTYVARDLVWRGQRWITDEYFFLARLRGRGQPLRSTGLDQEPDAYLGSDWVPWRKLDALRDPVIPDLGPVLQRLDPDGPWSTTPS
jgi:8-oxo-dGTP pyrophosphatase MutT (NUDIX family)/ribosomal protein S18 acetylase RimI-like enzyme